MTGIVIPDGGTIGSTSDTDALTITNTGVVKASQSIATGSIKDATGANNSISIATSGEATFADNIIVGTAGKGITFQDVANASTPVSSGNTLDHFEEGDFDASTTTSSGETTNNGKYVRIGQLVFVQLYLEWTNGVNNNGSTFHITGLPFNCQGNSYYAGASIAYVGSASMQDALGIVASATNKLYFHQNDGSSTSLKNTDIHARGMTQLIISATYYAD